MNKLVRLELRRNNVKTYVTAGGIITLCSLMMLYMFAVISRTSSDSEFFDYMGILTITSLLNMCCFSILGSVMYSRFIVEEYTGKRAMLLFSYPINRKKMLFSKLLLVTICIIGGILLCNLIVFSIFFLSESIIPIVSENLSNAIMIKIFLITILMCIIAASFSLISMVVGFWRKSIPVTIITTVLLCAPVSNFLSLSSLTLIPIIIIITVLAFVISIVTVQRLSNRINYLEV